MASVVNVDGQLFHHSRGKGARALIGSLLPLIALNHDPVVNCQESANARKLPCVFKYVVHALHKVVRVVIVA